MLLLEDIQVMKLRAILLHLINNVCVSSNYYNINAQVNLSKIYHSLHVIFSDRIIKINNIEVQAH